MDCNLKLILGASTFNTVNFFRKVDLKKGNRVYILCDITYKV